MKYTPENCEEFFKQIRLGLSMKDACSIIDISDETYYNWCKNRLEFLEGVKKAQAQFKQQCLALIKRASVTQWTAAAWLLERKHPDEFGLKTHQQISGTLGRETDEQVLARKQRVTNRMNELLAEKITKELKVA